MCWELPGPVENQQAGSGSRVEGLGLGFRAQGVRACRPRSWERVGNPQGPSGRWSMKAPLETPEQTYLPPHFIGAAVRAGCIGNTPEARRGGVA